MSIRGRPKVEERRRPLQVYLTIEQKEWLLAKAIFQECTASQIVRRLVQGAMNNEKNSSI